MSDGTWHKHLVSEVRGAAVGAARRAARVQAGMLRLQQAQLKLVGHQLLATLAVQRITVEVLVEGCAHLQQRVIDRLDLLSTPTTSPPAR